MLHTLSIKVDYASNRIIKLVMHMLSILIFSLLIHFATLYLSIRLIWKTKNKVAWIILSIAFSLMLLRRGLVLYYYVNGVKGIQADITFEVMKLLFSIFMLLGVAFIAPLFTRIEKSEAKTRESERTLETLISNLPGIAYRCRYDQNWTMEFISNACLELTGYSAQELVQNNRIAYSNIIHPEDREFVWNEIQNSVKRKKPFQITYRIFTSDGNQKWVWEKGRGIYDKNGSELFLEGFITDVTEQKRTEEQLRFQAQLLDNVRESVVATDLNDTIIYWGQGAQALYGYSPNEVLGHAFSQLIENQSLSHHTEQLEEINREGRWQGQHLQKNKEDKTFWADTMISLVLNEQKEPCGYIRIDRDLTERKKLEIQLQHSQKMEAIGRLAGGVAHDFNNILMVINGYCDVLMEQRDENSRLYNRLKEIRMAGDRAVELTRQLLTFSRKQVLQPKHLNLNHLIDGMAKMIQRLIGEDIQLKIIKSDNVGLVKSDNSQLEQIIMNLVVNARDAMVHGGYLTIQTANIYLNRAQASHYHGAKPGTYVLLKIQDSGCGMSSDVKERIFEPFFTTKEVGKGTGLGLSIVYGIVKQSEGFIHIDSELNVGTTFYIYFPRVEEKIEEKKSVQERETSLIGKESILLVEDDESVRTLIHQILESYGYYIYSAKNSEEAEDYFNEHKNHIHLLLTDVVMPGISGRKIAQQFLAQYPPLRVVYISGYTDDTIARHGILENDVAFLQKPFTAEELAKTVREVLDR